MSVKERNSIGDSSYQVVFVSVEGAYHPFFRLKKIQQKKRLIRQIEDEARAKYIQDQIASEGIAAGEWLSCCCCHLVYLAVSLNCRSKKPAGGS